MDNSVGQYMDPGNGNTKCGQWGRGVSKTENFCGRHMYRVTKVVADLGWVDLDLLSSHSRWAATVATYCPSQMVQYPKSKSTQPRSATTFVTLYVSSEVLGKILWLFCKVRDVLSLSEGLFTPLSNSRSYFALVV